jgi:hypothetical protein
MILDYIFLIGVFRKNKLKLISEDPEYEAKKLRIKHLLKKQIV